MGNPYREGVVEELEEDSTLQESLHVIHNNLKRNAKTTYLLVFRINDRSPAST